MAFLGLEKCIESGFISIMDKNVYSNKRELSEELVFIKNSKATQKKSTVTMEGKVCVITGTTSGVGLEAAKELARGNAHLVMVCRNREKAEKVKQDINSKYNVPIDIYIADFSELNQVRKVAKQILKNHSRIDVLINNIGIHSTTKKYNSEGIELVFCVNHLAPFLFTNLLLERLKKSAPARIIQVNSEGHRFNGLNLEDINWNKRVYTGLKGYGASKTAQMLTLWKFADNLRGTGVTINAMHPGDVRTNIGSNNGKLYNWFLHNITWRILKEPNISGQAIYYLAAAPELKETSGHFFNLTIDEKPAFHTINAELSKKVWELSIKMTDL